MQRIKKISPLLFGFAVILLLAIILPAFSTHADNGLIQCGRKGSATLCNICDLIQLAQSLINKILSYFVGPIAALMLGYGGFLMVLAGLRGGNASAFTQGKKVLTNTAGGIVLLFVSWLLIDTVLKLLGGYQYAPGSTKFGPWNEIECVSAEITLPNEVGCDGDSCKPVVGNAVKGCTVAQNCGADPHYLGCNSTNHMCEWLKGSAPNGCTEGEDPKCNPKYHKCSGTSCVEAEGSQADECVVLGPDNPSCKTAEGYQANADNAKKLEGRVNFSSSGDCNNKSAATNFQELLNKESLTVCHAGCSTDGTPCIKQDFTANGRMMVDLINLIDKYDFNGISVSSISTGDHASNSAHYKGNAIDIQSFDPTQYKRLRDQLRSFNPDSPYLVCEYNSTVITDCGPPTNHVHVTYP